MQQVIDLQTDLRRLGYLRRGIDGVFGPDTQRAVMALQYDLLFNTGDSSGDDGYAPVRMMDYNRGRVTAVTGVVDQALVECIEEILTDPRFPKLPAAPDPIGENRRIAIQIQKLPPTSVPTPFLVAVLKQETGLAHFAVPRGTDRDSFISVGTESDGSAPHAITARSYGAGRYTLFHHPPRPDEVERVMLDPAQNVEGAATRLRDAMDTRVNGPREQAEERLAERGKGPVQLCRYEPGDPRYMQDCRGCVAAAGFREVRSGLPLYRGGEQRWAPTAYHAATWYGAVPVRERLGCDWPYAVRRYYGSGLDSYHYQVRVLKQLALL